MRKALLVPGNGRRSNIKGDHLKASMCQLLCIIPQPTPNHEGELAFAPNVSAIQPPDEVGIDFHVSPVDRLLISLSLRVQCLKPARGIPPAAQTPGRVAAPLLVLALSSDVSFS